MNPCPDDRSDPGLASRTRSSTPSTRSASRRRPISRARRTRVAGSGASGSTTAPIPADQPIVRRCSAFLKESVTGVSMLSSSTKSTGSPDRSPTSRELVELFDAHSVSFVSVHSSLQYNHQHGPADALRAALFRPVRTRGHWRAHPRQDRRVEEEGPWMGGVVPLGYRTRWPKTLGRRG